MSSTDASLNADASFSAEPLDHQPGPGGPTPAERRGHLLALVAAAALHLIIPLAILAYYALWPITVAPPEQEIPVEIVVEPPKQEAQQDQPKPPPQPDDEKPAYDAPSAATQEKANRESPDKETQAPAADAKPPQNPGAPQQSETHPATTEQKPQASPPPEVAKPTPNAEEPAAATPSPSDADATPPADKVEPRPAPPPAPKPPQAAPDGAAPPPDDVLPQYKFAHAATESPVVGGNADTRYFTIVYGMIRSHLRPPSGSGAAPPSRGGAVVFTVDESGNLVERRLRELQRIGKRRHGGHGRDRRGCPLSGAAELATPVDAPDLRPMKARLTRLSGAPV